jgi:hypothetical protein
MTTSLTTVGVHDERGVALADVDLAPNPTSDWCTVTVSTPSQTSLTIDIVDITGTSLYTAVEQGLAAGQHRVRVPVQQLAIGNYIVRVTTDNGVTSERLQIIR